MDESDGDDAAAPEVAEETALSSAADNWGPEWKRKMWGQGPTQHVLHVEVMRVAANSPAKGILRLLAFYTRAGHNQTVDQIARSVNVPPGRVEELLGRLHACGHIAEHSAGGVTTYSARPDALERYLTSSDDADRAATPTPAPAPAPVPEAPHEGAPAAGPDRTGDARLAGDGDATPAEDALAPAPAPAREDAAPAVLTRGEGGTAPAPASRGRSPTPAEEETQGPAPKRRRRRTSPPPRADVGLDEPAPGPEQQRRGRSPARTMPRDDADAAAPAPAPAPPRRGRSLTPRTTPAGAAPAPAPAPRPRANSEPAPLAGAAPQMKKQSGRYYHHAQNRAAAKEFVEDASPEIRGEDKKKVTDSASLLTFRFELEGHATRRGVVLDETSPFAKDCGFAALAREEDGFEIATWADAEWRVAKWAWGPMIDAYQIPKSGSPLDAFREAISFEESVRACTRQNYGRVIISQTSNDGAACRKFVRTPRNSTPPRMWTKMATLPPPPLQSLIEGRRRDAQQRERRRP